MIAIVIVSMLQQFAPKGEWIALTDFQTDAWCTTAHDSVSGARVTDCEYAASVEPTHEEHCGSKERFVSLELRQMGAVEVQVVKCSDPNWYTDQLRADIGAVAIDESCSLRELLDASSVPSSCQWEYVFTTTLPDGRSHDFRLVACSNEQIQRALDYVSAVSLGVGPIPIEEQSAPTRPIPKADVEEIKTGTTLATVLSDYGPPSSVRLRHPDSFSLVYPILDASGLAVIHFNRERKTVAAIVSCVGEN